MIDNRLWEMFPETPDSFRKMVKQTVADQLTIERKRNVFRMPRVAAVAVVLVLVAGTTVGAANISKLKTYLAKWGYKVPEENVVSYENKEQTGMVQGNLLEATSDTNMAEKSMDDEKASLTFDEIRDSLSELEQKNLDVLKNLYIEGHMISAEEAEKKICDEWVTEPFLLMDEVYMDGSSLYYSAHLADGCDIKPIASKDHTFVNGVDCLNEFFEETDEPGHYVGSIDLTMNGSSDMNFVSQGDELAVMLNLYVDENSGETRLFTFSDKDWSGTADTTDNSGGEYKLGDYGKVTMDELLAAPSKITVKMTYTIDEESIKKLKEKYGYIDDTDYLLNGFFVEDGEGNRYLDFGPDGIIDMMGMNGIGINDGKFVRNFELDINQNFNMDTDTIRFIPYTYDRSEDGKHIPGTEREIPELSFEVKLK